MRSISHELGKVAPRALDQASLLRAVRTLTRRDRALAGLVAPRPSAAVGAAPWLHHLGPYHPRAAGLPGLRQRAVPAPRGNGAAFDPLGILAVGTAGLQGLGVTRQKARYVCELADRVSSGQLPLHQLSRTTTSARGSRQCREFGPWTADIYLLMALRRPDVWPPGDLALLKTLGRLGGSTLRSVDADAITARWRPFRAAAARILWHAYLAERAA